MTDKSELVAGRLRATFDKWNNPPSEGLPEGAGVMLEAADEIDRLTAALASERERAEKAERERAEADKKYRETLSLLNDSMASGWGTGMDAIALARRVTELEGASQFLWKLLDDIDTLDDAAKEGDARFRSRAYQIQRRRFEVGKTDGYTVEITGRAVLKETKDG